MARLDVAMFNALLREPGDDIPTDPISDPITDHRVLPIAAGKSSFGAGAQLKNAVSALSLSLFTGFGFDLAPIRREEDDSADQLRISISRRWCWQIGNWSRGLTDWFGIDDDDDTSEGEGGDDRRREAAASPKSFPLLNALSDLLMLPKDMLLDDSIRREVLPFPPPP